MLVHPQLGRGGRSGVEVGGGGAEIFVGPATGFYSCVNKTRTSNKKNNYFNVYNISINC